MSFHLPNRFRVRGGSMATTDEETYGLFFIPFRLNTVPLRCIAHDGVMRDGEGEELSGWEHVSVSLPTRCPTREEMDLVKGQFWDAEDAVMQLHPPRSAWVNCHPYTLHLWRPTLVRGVIPLPPAVLVGPVTG